MQNILVVVDMQNDFITGALGTKEAVEIVPQAVKVVREFPGRVLFTRDTHGEDYLETQEGKNLPVPHCIRETNGWQICPELEPFCREAPIDKVTFGSSGLSEILMKANEAEAVGTITFIGLCTDICVISNALLAKAFLPEAKIIVDASACAGVTPQSHRTALEAMKMCQIQVVGES